eukprot:CAMPEP_0174735102 /NCGR_PEP_ID=MMETSP1094-20130205/64387_1 /TAXON_ID=156173 /ORGANISM="Chrysochromulina brevifilum, Strain UTEX LB 985" /LENGTH=41 /DNA_ID= /DNA_START= /DNA_END= /DNA_ORIENTATION=
MRNDVSARSDGGDIIPPGPAHESDTAKNIRSDGGIAHHQCH